jgi:hypothetical protein
MDVAMNLQLQHGIRNSSLFYFCGEVPHHVVQAIRNCRLIHSQLHIKWWWWWWWWY